MAHIVYTGDKQSKNKSLPPYYRFIDSANTMTTHNAHIGLLFKTTDALKLLICTKNTYQIWSLGIKLMHLCDCGHRLLLFSLKYTQAHSHTYSTHNTTLHSHWHTFPEANPVDRSLRANPLSEQWFPQCKKTSKSSEKWKQ